MDPKELRDFERRPAFGVYAPEKVVVCHTCKGSGKLVEADPLPTHIQKIRDKWARLGVDLGAVWRIIRIGYNLYENNYVVDSDTPRQLTQRHTTMEYYRKDFLSKLSSHMRALVKRIRNDKRTQEQKDRDREILVAHCGKWTDESGPVDAFESFCEKVRRRYPLLDRVPLPDPRRRERGRPTEVVGPATYLIASLVKPSLTSKKGPKANRFYWTEVEQLLSFYYPWEKNLTKNHLMSFYNHHKSSGVPPDWPKLEVLRSFRRT